MKIGILLKADHCWRSLTLLCVCMCLCVHVRVFEQLRRETQAGRSWRGRAAAVETWTEGSGL